MKCLVCYAPKVVILILHKGYANLIQEVAFMRELLVAELKYLIPLLESDNLSDKEIRTVKSMLKGIRSRSLILEKEYDGAKKETQPQM